MVDATAPPCFLEFGLNSHQSYTQKKSHRLILDLKILLMTHLQWISESPASIVEFVRLCKSYILRAINHCPVGFTLAGYSTTVSQSTLDLRIDK